VLEQEILFCGQQVLLRCDGRCDKAFGINGRPQRSLSDDEDDYVFLSDAEVGEAPPPGKTVGMSEGGHMKPSATPLTDPSQMNKWCARECERSILTETNEPIPDLSNPQPNCGWRRESV
jgi:hypothetical protein